MTILNLNKQELSVDAKARSVFKSIDNNQTVKLLLNFDSSFEDESQYNHFLERSESVTLNTSIKKFGNSSAYFNGSCYLAYRDSDEFFFGVEDFTIELWFYPTNSGTDWQGLVGQRISYNNNHSWYVYYRPTNNSLSFEYTLNSSSCNTINFGPSVSLNAWHHLAVCRSGSILYCFVDGILYSNTISNLAIYNSSNPLRIGWAENANYFTGYIDNLIIHKGLCKYTSSITVPTSESTITANTRLLIHGNQAHKNINNRTIYSYGDSNINTSYYKFGDGSGYFDGSGDYLTIPYSEDFDFGTGDFTIDLWVYIVSISGYCTILEARPSASYSNFILGVNTSNKLDFVVSSGRLTSTNSIQLNQWQHIVFIRISGILKCFINGVLDVTTYSYNSTLNSGRSSLYIGLNVDGNYVTGYFDELRISKGIARWTSNFTPPSSTYTTDQYTKLLMHFPSTDKNQVGKTITRYGDAKISTSQYKFGNSSGYFDGSGDWLKIGLVSDLQFGSDDFTIDCWVRLSVINKRHDIYSSSDADDYNLLVFEIDANNKLKLWMSSTGGSWNIANGVIGTYSFSENIWYHVALVRNSDTFKAYVDGALDLSVTSSASLFPANSGFSIGNAVFTGIYYFYGYIDEFRISKGIARYTENFTPPTSQHTTDQYTKLLLHFNAPNNTGTFIDSSQSMDRFTDASNSLDLFQDSYDTSRLFTSYNIPQISTDIYKFNSAALYFNGTSYITSPNSGDFNFGTEDFTISFWMHSPIAWSAQTAQAGIIGQKYSDSTYGWVISRDANNPTKLNFRGALTNNFPTLSTPGQNIWEHWCVIRSSGSLYWYKNGALDSVANTNANNLIDVSADLYIGSAQTWGQKANIYLDEIIILKGIALNSFTVPTTPSLSNLSTSLQVYSENIIISNKKYSAKFIADTNSLNKYTYTKFSNNLDLSKYKYLYFKLYPTVTGSKIKFSLNNLNNHNNIISGGTATADAQYDSNYIPSYGCDRNTANRWQTNNSAFPHWWKYDFGLGVSKIVKKIRILNFYDSSGQFIRDFYFQGSNNDTDYTTIYTGNAAPICLSSWFEFNFENSVSYRYYKLVFLNSYRTDYYSGFWEIEFYETNDNLIEYTPNITNISTWQDVVINLSNYSWKQKYNIDKLLITILNSSTNNTFYIDDIYACNDQDLINLQHNYQFTAYKDILNKLTGSSSLKFIANQSTSINKQITRKLTTPIDLSSKSKIVFAIYSNRSGSKFKIKFINSKLTELITKTSTRTYHVFNSNTTFNPGESGSINATIYGAGGAGGGVGGWRYGARGGNGGKSIGTISVTNQSYYIAAGAEGICHGTNTLNGRSNMSSGDNNYAGQSGGYAGIFIGSASQANALLIAGGGGGGGSSRAGVLSTGGAGGGLTGQDGVSIYDNKFQYAGRGASQTSSGSDATSDSANYSGGQAALQGGRPRTNSYGGGGGGGYFGGSAGGYSESHTMAGGGGGSGYYNPTYVTNQVLTTGDGSEGGEPLENGQPGIVMIDYLSSDFPERQATSLIEITPDITNINQWELFELDITNISTTYKNAIDQIQVEMLNDAEETIFYIDYIFSTAIYYIDPTNGNNANTGLSWATAWKTITGGPTSARTRSGDLIKIAKSIDPVSIGPAQWNNLSKTVTLSNTPDGSLTSTSLISKNINNDGWYPVQSVTNLIILINNHYANSGASGRGYFGSTELIETYRRETYKLASSSDCTIQLSGDFYMSNRGHIKFEGGYNQSTDIQDGETYFDAVSGAGNGLDLSNRSYISLNKLNMVRANYGLTLSSSNYNIVNSNSIVANTMHSLYVNNSNYNILELLNLINNGNDGFRLVTNTCTGNKLTTRNINNNLSYGISLTYSYENNIYAVNCANNGATNIYFVQLCNNNKLKILNNKNSLGYGIDFGPNVNDNDIFNSSFSGNSLGSIKTINANQNYFFNAEFNDTIKIGSFTQYCDHKVFSNSESGDITKNYVYTDRGNIYSQNIIRHSNSGMAWTLGINNVICSEQYPLELCIARVLCLKNTPITISCYLMRGSDTVTGRLIIKKYQVPELETDLYHDIESIGSWEQAQIIFQVSIDCVLEIHAQAFGGSSNSVYVDDFNCSQV